MPRDTGARAGGSSRAGGTGRPTGRGATTGAPGAAIRTTTPRAIGLGIAGAVPVSFDRASDPDAPALDALSADLAAAGRRARNRKAQVASGRPDPAFRQALGGRLLESVRSRTSPVGPALDAPLQPTLVMEAARPSIATTVSPEAAAAPLTGPRFGVRPSSSSRRRNSARASAAAGIALVVLAVAAGAVFSGRFAPAPANRVGEAADATLIRSGSSQALAGGAALAVGDEIRVAADGHATLDLGSSQARLASGADIRLDVLSGSAVQLALLAGRTYQRVVLPVGGSYAVVTGAYTWTATGTAFDLDRTSAAAGGEQVTLLALEHAVAVDGPDAQRQIAEGSTATVLLGDPASTGVTVGPIPTSAFSDPWLINNAKTDESLGYSIGALAGVALAPNDAPSTSPSPSLAQIDSPSDRPSDRPSAGVSPSDSPSPRPGLTPSPRATPTAKPSPTPAPTPTPTFGLALTSCPGGVVLDWSKYSGTGFARYVTLRSSSPYIAKARHQPNVTEVAGTTDRTRTSGADAAVTDGFTYFYRTLALDSANHVLAASDVTTGLGYARMGLGPVSFGQGVVSWAYFPGPAACFSEYRVLYSTIHDLTNGGPPIAVTKQLQSNVPLPSASHGQTFYFEVQVLRVTAVGQIVVAQTDIQSYVYP